MGEASARVGHEPAGASDARPWLLGGGAGRKPARLAGDRHDALAPERAAAMRGGGGRAGATGTTRAAVAAAIGGGRATSSSRCRRTPRATRCCARHRRGAGGGAGRAGSAISRRPGSMATARAAGSTRTSRARAGQRARRAGGWRRRRAGARPGCRSMIFRLAGIYGPGRSALRPAARAGGRSGSSKPGQVFSRIHVEDIATALRARRWRGRRRGGPTTSPTTSRRRRRTSSPSRRSSSGCRCRRRSRSRRPTLSPMARSFYERVEAGLEPADPGGTRGGAAPGPTTARGCAAILARGRLRDAATAWRKTDARSVFRAGNRRGYRRKDAAKSREKAPERGR